MEFQKVLIAPKTYLAIILIVAAYFFSVLIIGERFRDELDSTYYFYTTRNSHIDLLMIGILGFGFSMSFLEDWKHKYALQYIIRSGAGRYAASKAVLCFVCSWLASFIGIHLFLAILSLRRPFIVSPQHGNIYETVLPYGALAYSGIPYLFVFVTASITSAAYAFWTVVGLLLSTFFSNAFVVIGLPVILSYYLQEFTLLYVLPVQFNISYISRWGGVGTGIWSSFLYSIFFFVVLSILAGLVFYKRLKGIVDGEIC